MALWAGGTAERSSLNFLEYNKWAAVNFSLEEDFLTYANINRKTITYWQTQRRLNKVLCHSPFRCDRLTGSWKQREHSTYWNRWETVQILASGAGAWSLCRRHYTSAGKASPAGGREEQIEDVRLRWSGPFPAPAAGFVPQSAEVSQSVRWGSSRVILLLINQTTS